MKLIGDYYKPDLVLIPIGGHFTMGPKDAAYAVNQWLKPKFAIPMHYGTFGVLKGTPGEFSDALGKSKTRMLGLNPGDKHDF
jgi:L-ascorbate metabolism protein UlaG (beta-lactamase superfamily)